MVRLGVAGIQLPEVKVLYEGYTGKFGEGLQARLLWPASMRQGRSMPGSQTPATIDGSIYSLYRVLEVVA